MVLALLHGGQANKLKVAQHTNPNGKNSTVKSIILLIFMHVPALYRLKSALIWVTNITSSVMTVFGWKTIPVFTKEPMKARQVRITRKTVSVYTRVSLKLTVTTTTLTQLSRQLRTQHTTFPEQTACCPLATTTSMQKAK